MLIGDGFGKGIGSFHPPAEISLATPGADLPSVESLEVAEVRPLRRERPRVPTRSIELYSPRWLQALDGCQRARRDWLPIGLDLLVAGTTVLAATGSLKASACAAGTFFVAGLTFGLYRSRTSVEAQGIMWYLERSVPAVLCVSTVETLCLGMRDREVLGAVTAFLSVLVLVRSLLWVVIGSMRRRGRGLSRTLVVGPQGGVETIKRRMEVFPEAGLQCVHSYVPRGRRACRAEHSRTLVTRLLREHRIEHVVCIAGDANHDVYKDFVRFAASETDVTIIEP